MMMTTMIIIIVMLKATMEIVILLTVCNIGPDVRQETGLQGQVR